MRIVSLIASATEIVCALGAEKLLVGRSHECDYPLSVRNLPQVTEPKFELDGTSYQIDQRIKAILQEGLSIYRVDAERLNELQPDVIITQTQCAVCAVSEADVQLAVSSMVNSNPLVVSLLPNRLSDIWSDIRKVGAAIGAETPAEMLISQMKSRMTQIRRKTRRLRSRLKVATIEWIDPLMAAGNWMPTLVRMAGGDELFGSAGKHSPFMTPADLFAADPDLIFISPCGFDIERTKADLPILTGHPDWPSLRAVRNNRVFVADGNQYFNRPGPRVVETLEILGEVFWPDGFHFGFEGIAWERVTAPV